MPIDPQAQRSLDRLAAQAAGSPVAGEVTVDALRKNARARRVMEVVDRVIPGPFGSTQGRPAGEIPVRIFTPAGEKPLPALVYFHGGGWVTGDLDTTDLRCRILAEWAGCVVVSVDYRMAPEHRFPAAVEDSYAATCWVADHTGELGVDARRLAVGGDSAGGNLAAVVAILARDKGMPTIAFQYLVYPVTDCDLRRASYIENDEGYGLSAATMRWYWAQYVPNEADRTNPLASPLRAPDLRGLPPAFVITAEYDPLRDEGEAYAQRLREAGVPVQLKRYSGLIHGFLGQAGELDQGKIATIDSATALREAFTLAAVIGK